MTHLLDTDHLSILEHPTGAEFPVVTGHISRHPAGSVVVSVASIHEQLLGANALISQAKTPKRVIQGYDLISQLLAAIRPFAVLPFDDPAAAVFAHLRARRIRIGTLDLRIAAIARSRNLVVVTRNARDFGQVPGLATEDWTK